MSCVKRLYEPPPQLGQGAPLQLNQFVSNESRSGIHVYRVSVLLGRGSEVWKSKFWGTSSKRGPAEAALPPAGRGFQ